MCIFKLFLKHNDTQLSQMSIICISISASQYRLLNYFNNISQFKKDPPPQGKLQQTLTIFFIYFNFKKHTYLTCCYYNNHNGNDPRNQCAWQKSLLVSCVLVIRKKGFCLIY